MRIDRRMLRNVRTAWLCATAALAAAGPALGQSPREEVRAELQRAASDFAKGVPAKINAPLFYTPDIVFVGQGDASLQHGMDAVIEATQAFMDSLGPNGTKGCVFELANEPTVSSATTYVAFVLIRCQPNPPALKEVLDTRVLYVWKKTKKGWRVALEMYEAGKL